MKRWALVTVGLYVAALLLITLPLWLLAFSEWWAPNGFDAAEALAGYWHWGYWVWIGFFAAAQAGLLLVPLRVAERRLRSRRPLIISALITALLLGLLTFAGLGCLVGAVFSDDGLDSYLRFMAFTVSGPEGAPLSGTRPTSQTSDDVQAVLGSLNVMLVFWVIWGLVFWRQVRTRPAGSMMQRCVNWLLRGSILELLIAVPSHVVVRRREDCCAPGMTMAGLATGLSVMLLCFGPGVFWLFVKRARGLKPRHRSPG